ncbi:MAG: RluA family pseudouridine synthase [Parvularculaceae bacterium]
MSGVATRRVAPADDGLRLDRWFRAHYPALSHGALEKLLRKGQIRVNGGRVKASRRVAAGEEVRVPPLPEAASAPASALASAPGRRSQRTSDPADAARLRDMTIYEDEQLIALNKPFGLAVQGGSKTTRHVDGMLAAREANGDRPRLTHRLDRDTGGVLVVAKTRVAAAALAGAFRGRDVEKTYWALAVGAPRPREGTIRLDVAKRMARGDEGRAKVVPAAGEDAKFALTDFQTVDVSGAASFLALKPVTGRTHQLRVHCAAIGHPIVGDRKYGGPEAVVDGVAPRLHLFCREMRFAHPATGAPLSIVAPLTGHMADTWRFFGFDANARVDWPDLKKPSAAARRKPRAR